METDIFNIISNFGFPITMVMYFVFRMEKILREHTEAINQLTIILNSIISVRR